jgi:hypothetical protein
LTLLIWLKRSRQSSSGRSLTQREPTAPSAPPTPLTNVHPPARSQPPHHPKGSSGRSRHRSARASKPPMRSTLRRSPSNPIRSTCHDSHWRGYLANSDARNEHGTCACSAISRRSSSFHFNRRIVGVPQAAARRSVMSSPGDERRCSMFAPNGRWVSGLILWTVSPAAPRLCGDARALCKNRRGSAAPRGYVRPAIRDSAGGRSRRSPGRFARATGAPYRTVVLSGSRV